ncbi:uncharacterized protein MONBRDRAFT_13402 [Monosiga brevicollis MX1]|uniref:ribose-phosphate diphosphokinase n=1 Tax=Monosiga brevicollis TaxID=81824 RepID=A9UQS7_MONBE|nr:uncharacterized protein MONBRDRAFT_13402 [Monosiga brevicollis MX1]EDQ92649.1 predicted protein [Monosiga brevicollis MX1]|eukprot:XP_001742411.1 hypothetical protein [Monosiga brevicollis MX1]
MKLLGGNTNPELWEKVADYLSAKMCNLDVAKFANGETQVIVRETVRQSDVYILQSGCGDVSVNDAVMELCILAQACSTSSAQRVTAVLPYFPYSKQSKQKRRGTIAAKLVADLLQVAGVSHILTLDLHHMQMQGFFGMPVDNVKCSPLLADYILHQIPNGAKCVIAAKNAGASKRAAVIAKRLGCDFAMIFGEQTNAQGDGVIGEVYERDVVIVDDVIDGAESFVKAAQLFKDNGADNVYIIATHGILSGKCPEELQECDAIQRVVVTNTIPQRDHMARCPKLATIDCSDVLGEAVRRLHFDESLYAMYSPPVPATASPARRRGARSRTTSACEN